MKRQVEKSLLDVDFAALTRGPFTPSPAAWEDHVLYFLMLDRFSDGNENGGYCDVVGRPVMSGTTPLYRTGDKGRVDYDTWFRAGFAIYHASPSLHRLGPDPPEDLKPWPREVWHAWTQRT